MKALEKMTEKQIQELLDQMSQDQRKKLNRLLDLELEIQELEEKIRNLEWEKNPLMKELDLELFPIQI